MFGVAVFTWPCNYLASNSRYNWWCISRQMAESGTIEKADIDSRVYDANGRLLTEATDAPGTSADTFTAARATRLLRFSRRLQTP